MLASADVDEWMNNELMYLLYKKKKKMQIEWHTAAKALKKNFFSGF